MCTSSEVGRADIAAAFREVGAVSGDILIFHSSLKSMGHVQGGAPTVIDGALDSVSPGGTVAIPTLWYNGKPLERKEEDFDLKNSPAWNGAVAEAMRQDPRAVRSSHFSHSVSSIGKDAEYLASGHGGGRGYPSPWSETAFAEVSPWSRLYEHNALYAFIGCEMTSCTMKHWIESRYVAELLYLLPEAERAKFRSGLAFERQPGPWCSINGRFMRLGLAEKGLIRETRLGDAVLFALRTRPMVDETLAILRREPEKWFTAAFLQWRQSVLDTVRDSNKI